MVLVLIRTFTDPNHGDGISRYKMVQRTTKRDVWAICPVTTTNAYCIIKWQLFS